MLAPVFTYLRKQGIQIFIYLDDILVVGHSLQEVKGTVYAALKTLTQVDY